jgi:hypothetical protein
VRTSRSIIRSDDGKYSCRLADLRIASPFHHHEGAAMAAFDPLIAAGVVLATAATDAAM